MGAVIPAASEGVLSKLCILSSCIFIPFEGFIWDWRGGDFWHDIFLMTDPSLVGFKCVL